MTSMVPAWLPSSYTRLHVPLTTLFLSTWAMFTLVWTVGVIVWVTAGRTDGGMKGGVIPVWVMIGVTWGRVIGGAMVHGAIKVWVMIGVALGRVTELVDKVGVGILGMVAMGGTRKSIRSSSESFIAILGSVFSNARNGSWVGGGFDWGGLSEGDLLNISRLIVSRS